MLALPLKDKAAPSSLEAETAVLGSLLLDWNAVGKIVHLLRPESFYSKRNGLIYEAMLSLYNKGEPGDELTLQNELTALVVRDPATGKTLTRGALDEAGGVAYLSGLTAAVPTAANIEYYAKVVLDCALRRDLIKASSEVIASSHDETKESRLTLEDAQNKFLALTDFNKNLDIRPMSDTIMQTVTMIEKRRENRNAHTGIESGLTDLDNLTDGFQNAELIIIGARPSIGKTALALSMVQTIAIENRIPTGFFSLEMPYQSIGMRLLSQESRISANKLRTGLLSTADYQKLTESAGRCYEAPLFITDSPSTKLLDLRALARRMILEHGVQIIFIDYISLIQSENPALQRHEQVAEISRSLKGLARELNVPVVALSQLNRDTEKTRHEPTLADIRESGSIEQDADVVIFIHRDRGKQQEGGEGGGLETKLIVAKQRNGPIGDVKVLFFPQYTKFENAARTDF